MKRLPVAIIVLILIVGGSYTAWHHWHDRGTTKNATQQTDLSEGGKYLVINEWNIRFKLNDTISDAKYSYKDGHTVHLTTAKFQQLPGCQQSDAETLERGNGDDYIGATTVNDLLAHNPKALIKVGNYYYSSVVGGLSCFKGDDPTQQSYYRDVQTTFNEAIKSLEETGR